MDKTLGKCLRIAGELLRQRKFDDALEILVTVSVGLLSPAQKALYSLLLADARLNKGYTDVDKPLELALAYYSAGADNLKYALALYLHGWRLQSLGNLPAAKEALMGAYLNFQRCNDSAGQARALCRLSSVQVHVGDFQGAITHLKRCCEVYQSIGEEKAATAMSSNVATIYVSVGNIREAISQYESLAPAIGKVGSKDMAIYFTVSAIPHALLGDTRKAEGIISKALPYLDTLPRDRAIYYEYLGTIHLLEGDYAAAEKVLLQGLKISLDVAPESALVSQIKRRLGDACLGLGRFDSAKRYTEEGLAVAEKINERAEIAACWRILAQLEHRHGNTEKARDWFDRAIDLFNRIGSMYELAATRYLAARSGLFGEGGRQALLYLAREYFEKETVKPYLEKIDREMKTVAEPEIPRPKTDGNEPPLVITVNPAMTKNLETARNIAPSDMAILLTGPSGVGKDLLAKYIHYYSGRAGRFILVNTPAIPDDMVESELFGHKKGAFTGADADKIGLIEEAEGGTLYLNEIGDASPKLQAKLLDVLESKKFRRLGETKARRVDFRIIAATNHDLDELIRQRRFRADLFHRLNQVNLDLPPISTRRDDIPALVMHFLACFGVAVGGNGDGLCLDRLVRNLSARDWPGNIRQLRNEVEKLALIHRGGLSGMAACSGPSGSECTDHNRLLALLEQYDWNQSAVARALGVTEGAVRHWMARYGVRSPKSRNGTNHRRSLASGQVVPGHRHPPVFVIIRNHPRTTA